MWRFVVAIPLIAACPLIAHGQERVVGNWIVKVDRDRFSGDSNVIAMTIQDGNILAVRCLQRTLSLAIRNGFGPSGYKVGDIFLIKFKADSNPVVDTIGDAVDDSVIEVFAPTPIPQQLLSAREYAFRITTPSGTQFDQVFSAGLASKALVDVIRACPTEQK